MSNTADLKSFAIELFKINAIKFGEYKTKIGLMTPVYCDLRVLVSYPALLETLANLIINKLKVVENVDLLCGVPYTALPIATTVSLNSKLPMVMRRKEAKSYGTKKLIEGVFKPGDKCLIVEDVVTSGSSILETVKDLTNEGIHCTDAIVLLNREQGGSTILEGRGIKLHSILTLTELTDYLVKEKLISPDISLTVSNFLQNNQVTDAMLSAPKTDRRKMPFSLRAKLSKNPIAKQLFEIMEAKQTTLCLAADVTNSKDLLNLAEHIGPHICLLKTHIDIIEDFHSDVTTSLRQISERHNFILFEDRKFADIGKTVELQYSKGSYHISEWAALVTAHSITGKGVLDALKAADGITDRGVFLLAETSAAGNLITEKYSDSTIKLALEYPELITGIVCQSPLFLDHPELIQLTPGVQINNKSDDLGQQYNTPESVVLERGADVAVIGRGITASTDPEKTAKIYKKLLWDAYISRVK